MTHRSTIVRSIAVCSIMDLIDIHARFKYDALNGFHSVLWDLFVAAKVLLLKCRFLDLLFVVDVNDDRGAVGRLLFMLIVSFSEMAFTFQALNLYIRE